MVGENGVSVISLVLLTVGPVNEPMEVRDRLLVAALAETQEEGTQVPQAVSSVKELESRFQQAKQPFLCHV